MYHLLTLLPANNIHNAQPNNTYAEAKMTAGCCSSQAPSNLSTKTCTEQHIHTHARMHMHQPHNIMHEGSLHTRGHCTRGVIAHEGSLHTRGHCTRGVIAHEGSLHTRGHCTRGVIAHEGSLHTRGHCTRGVIAHEGSLHTRGHYTYSCTIEHSTAGCTQYTRTLCGVHSRPHAQYVDLCPKQINGLKGTQKVPTCTGRCAQAFTCTPYCRTHFNSPTPTLTQYWYHLQHLVWQRQKRT